MIPLILATRNPHKTREVREILADEFEVTDLTAHPEIPEIIESGKTFAENAAIKAVAVSGRLDGLIIADDSGLEVDLLGGAPGIYSARYAGSGATDRQNIERLRNELVNTCAEQRAARFRCVIALARGSEIINTFVGVVEGKVIDEPRGHDGFGYDPIFVPNGFDQTFAELPANVKNQISHRGRALRALREGLHSLRQ